MDNQKIIEQLGLNEREARVYLAMLELGGETIKRIAEKANLERTGTYYLIEGLIEKGLSSLSFRGKRKIYLAADPKKLVKIEEEKLANIRAILPHLEAIHNLKPVKPTIRFYEGKNGFQEIYNDMIQSLKKLPEEKREMLTYASADSIFALFPEHTKEFTLPRVRSKIKIRWIAPDTEFNRTFKKNERDVYREIRLVPKEEYPFETEMEIYGDKIALFGLKDDHIGVIIEHPAIAKTQREIFNLAWESTGNYKKQFYDTGIFESWLETACPQMRQWFDKENEALERLADKNSSVLDVGCGFGRHIKLLAPKVRRITGIDNNSTMIEKAKGELSGIGSVALMVGEAHDTGLEAESFDLIICMTNTFGNLIDTKLGALTEMARLAKPGGKIVVSVYSENALDVRISDYKRVGLHIEKIEDGRIYTKEGLVSEQFDKNELGELFAETKLSVEIQKITPLAYLCIAKKQ